MDLKTEIRNWWESRRFRYNMGLVIAGITAFFAYAILGGILIVPYEMEFEITIFTMFFQGMGYLVMMGIANLFYGLGELVDRKYNKGNREQFRQRLFRFGYWFSFALPFLIPLSIVVSYFILYY